MSTYNMVNGTHPFAGAVLTMLDKEADWFPRFRDAYILRDPARLVVMTRTGEGSWADEDTVAKNKDIEALPGFIEAKNDSFDKTFRHFYFEVPEEYRERTANVIKMVVDEEGIDHDKLFRNPMNTFVERVEAMGRK
jgi:hypothetical protein